MAAAPCAANPALARKIQAAILQRLAEASQIAVSTALDVSEATISRLKSEHLESFAAFLAALELKVVPAHAKCYEPEYIEHLRFFASKGLEREPRALEWDEE
jgi:Ran GTPase-activating protein (RanGAP) involved in mRNA processing and transport